MNNLMLARNAYNSSTTVFRTARDTELEAFRRVTHRLRASNPKSSYADFCAALNDNRSLWNTIAADVADDQNELPNLLRAQIFYLAEFTELQTSKILRGQADAQALISINAAVMRGLETGTK